MRGFILGFGIFELVMAIYRWNVQGFSSALLDMMMVGLAIVAYWGLGQDEPSKEVTYNC